MNSRRSLLTLFLSLGCLLLASHCARAQEFEQPPIRYSHSQPDNAVTRLAARLESGEAKLAFDDRFGYLPALLDALAVPKSSQMLVFSKTSMQRHRIAPRTPRALYFNDETYVGYCRYGEVLEISTADPQLGAVFYTLDQEQSTAPRLQRQTDNCLICHGSSQTKEVPGHVVRSLFVDTSGMPILSAGTTRVDQTTPLAKRWGGWYVTGTHGSQSHLGNLVIQGRAEPDKVDNAAGHNVTDLSARLETSEYLTPHSDIVALLVLEHQADAHNYLTRANILSRQALHYQESLNRELGEPEGKLWESTTSRIKNAGEPLLKYLLFSEEAPLTAPIQGTSGFAEEFAALGRRDSQGRSLRDFDLAKRLFKYPCSYLIYSPQFAALPAPVKDYVLLRMHEVLTGQDQSEAFAHLSAADRQAIREILCETLPGLPDYWRGNGPAAARG